MPTWPPPLRTGLLQPVATLEPGVPREKASLSAELLGESTALALCSEATVGQTQPTRPRSAQLCQLPCRGMCEGHGCCLSLCIGEGLLAALPWQQRTDTQCKQGASASRLQGWVFSLSVVGVTNCHQFGGFKQHHSLSYSSEGQLPGWSQLGPLLGVLQG